MDKFKFTKKYESGFSVKDLMDAGACEQELYRFAFHLIGYGYYSLQTKIPIDVALACAMLCKGGLSWILSNGFIEKDNPNYHIGQKFRTAHSSDFYIIASADMEDSVVLVNMFTGYCYGATPNPVKVKDPRKITIDEFKKIAGYSSWKEFIPAGDIKIEQVPF